MNKNMSATQVSYMQEQINKQYAHIMDSFSYGSIIDFKTAREAMNQPSREEAFTMTPVKVTITYQKHTKEWDDLKRAKTYGEDLAETKSEIASVEATMIGCKTASSGSDDIGKALCIMPDGKLQWVGMNMITCAVPA